MTFADFVTLALKASLFLIVFALGLRATFSDVTYLLARPVLLFKSILSMNIAMLGFALAAASFFPLPLPLKIALIGLAMAPVPPILTIRQRKAAGTSSYAISLCVTASFLAVVLVPLAIALADVVLGERYQMPAIRVAPIVLVSVILPLVLGMLVERFSPAVARQFVQPIARLGTGLLILAAVPVLIVTLPATWVLIGNGLILSLALFTAFGLLVGHIMGGPHAHDRVVLALATGARHPGVAMAIAAYNFPDEKAAVAVVLLHVFIGALVAIPYLKFARVNAAQTESLDT
ncbi:bile acid:sodium symporter family protein [Rhizobium sp. CF142]|uniref:bile acid:sodium symporter family protein n=1 Tax=Rhizobium sp. CF142 TaxID=1144314 RepID=UPI00026F00AF|nr:Na+-dependent transporter [Rhizobium sp. CF142]EJJ29197.1 putative Na+-dependent transporter [Rhizobium sp. CF142]